MPRVLRVGRMEECIGCHSCVLACARMVYKAISQEEAAIRIRTAGGFHSSMVADVCMACTDPSCAAACRAGALIARPGGGVIVKRDRCIGCRDCERACAVEGIRYNEDLGFPIVCTHCGICASFCDHGCLTLEEVHADA